MGRCWWSSTRVRLWPNRNSNCNPYHDPSIPRPILPPMPCTCGPATSAGINRTSARLRLHPDPCCITARPALARMSLIRSPMPTCLLVPRFLYSSISTLNIVNVERSHLHPFGTLHDTPTTPFPLISALRICDLRRAFTRHDLHRLWFCWRFRAGWAFGHGSFLFFFLLPRLFRRPFPFCSWVP